MKNKRVMFLLLTVVLTACVNDAAAQSTDGTVSYTVQTTADTTSAQYSPKNIAAVWVVDSAGKFIHTLCYHAASRINYLAQWKAARGTYTGVTVDGVTSATLSSQPQTHTVRWNCRGTNGLLVADGTYTVRAEYTSANGQGPYCGTLCSFVKGTGSAVSNYPSFANGGGTFQNMSLTYTPYNEIAVTGLTPSSGVISSNVAVVVSVTNQTQNPLSFNVAVSNVTSGTLIGTLPVTALAGKAVTNLTVNWSTAGLTAAPYQIRAVASSLATETNTVNNVLAGTITLSSQTAGDIAVTSLTPATGIINSLVPLQVTVANKRSEATGPFWVAISNLTAAATLTSYSNAWRVAASADDAEENLTTHAVTLTSTDLELTVDSANQELGIRFQNVSVPKDATITSAFIQFTDKTGEDLNIDPIALTVRGQAADSAAAFSATASDITSRPGTAATVGWTPPTWVDAAAGPNQRTPNLKSVVQEIVARSGWTIGNAMAFKITGSGARRAWSYDGNNANAPQLIVQWTTASHLIATQQIANLAASAVTNLSFSWSTVGVTAGVYQVSALAGPLATETFTSDNTQTRAVTLRDALHDLAIQAVTITSMVPPNTVTNIIVAVTNRGDLSESFSATLTDITSAPLAIGTKSTNVAAFASVNVAIPWATTGVPLGSHSLQAGVSVVPGETSTGDNTNVVAVVVASSLTTNALVAKTSVWKYLDKGLDITGAPWLTPDYYDGFWDSGAAPLGYGLTNIATTIGYGGVSTNRVITTYFRREFTMDFVPMSVTGRMMRTHGAVLYLNGTEIARQNMPAGTVVNADLASETVTGSNATNYFVFTIPPGILLTGRNLLTAELHLASPTNTTAGFAVELTSVNPTIPPTYTVAPSALTPDGAAQSGDASGVSVTLSNTGNTTSSCLVLIKDSVTGAILASQLVGPLVPGEARVARLILSTFGAATGSRTLQAITVCNGITNLATVASAPFTLSAPSFTPNTVAAAGSIGGRCNAVAVSGRYVYLGCGSTLETWDALSPAAPVRTGMIRLPGIIENLAASNNWVFAATGSAGVQIVDASAPTQLIHRATFDTTGYARRLTLAGDLLYVADVLSGVRVLNVSNPAAPTLAGAYQPTGPAQAVAYASPRLLVLDGQRGLQNLTATNPATLSVTGSYSRVTAGLALTAVSGAALATDANGGLFRISTAVPSVLTVVTNTLLPAAGLNLAASGSTLYVAAGAQGLLTLDANTLSLKAANDVAGEASDVAVSGNTLYVAAGFAGCLALDIASPLAPQPLGVFRTGARPVDAAASGSTLYVAADEGGLQIHSLQNLALPTLLGAIPSLNNSRCVAVAYPNLFVAEGLAGLKIYSITDPAAPVLLGSYAATDLSHIRRLAIAGNRAVITDGRKIQLLSVSNLGSPVLLATLEPGGFVFDVAAIPGEVYAACGGAGLKVLRMDTLGLDNTYITPGSATGVTVISNRLYVACGRTSWQTLNIDNAANPVWMQTTSSSKAFGIAAAGPLVYLSEGTRNAKVMNVSAPLVPVSGASFGNITDALRVRSVGGLTLTAEDEAGLAILNASPGDINLNGVPDSWEQQIVDSSVQTNGPVRSVLDVDLATVGPNGFTYYQSYLAGLTPTDPNSVLAISAVTPLADAENHITVRWYSVAGKRYTLYKTTDLSAEFTAIPAATGIVAAGPQTSFTDTVSSARAFYMVVLTP